MARELTNIRTFVNTDGDGNPQSAFMTYDVEDGAAKKMGETHAVDTPVWTKTFHNTGAVGEFVRDEIDLIKTAEGI